jgi:hypothetical protein
MKNHQVSIFVNDTVVSFKDAHQTGLSIKEHASIPADHLLYLGNPPTDFNPHEAHHEKSSIHNEIHNHQAVIVKNAQHFWTRKPHKGVNVTINRILYHFDNTIQTGEALKLRAGIDLADVLFRSRPNEDEVIPNDSHVTLHREDCFHSAPPANYGDLEITPEDIGCNHFECIPQPDGWNFLLIRDFLLPDGYQPERAELLVKLPPGFPDAAPDMFWVNPHVRTIPGTAPQGTSVEPLLGADWQRFSWHLAPGGWRPGISTLRDFMRCIRSRFERRN